MNTNTLINAWMAQKAGMKNVDYEAIAKKVEEITRGTNKALHEQQLQKKRQIEIAKMKEKIEEYHSNPDKDAYKVSVQKRVEMVQMRRDLSRVWAHFDFDMFYIACELLDHPQDIDKPCAVGTPDSVLCTANYVARKYGVRSALPSFIALKLCPELILYKPNFQKYKKYSKIMRSILQKYDQNYESMGLDEAYLDITQYVDGKSLEEVDTFIREIRQRVYEETGLTVSCGVGANKQLCKMASEEKKPNDQFILPNDKQQILKYLSGIPIRKIPGIGPVTEHYLKGLGVNYIRQVLERIDELSVVLSDNTVQSLIESCLGIDRNYHTFRQRKSVSRSQTFKPIEHSIDIDNKIVELAGLVSNDLNQMDMLTKHIAVGYQTEKYEKKEKSKTLDQYVSDKARILKVARQLIEELEIKEKIRLISIKCSQLVDETEFKQNSIEAFINKKKQPSKAQTTSTPMKEVRSAEKTQNPKAPQMVQERMQQQKVAASQHNVLCPICGKMIQTKGNNIILNKHIDRCLQMDGAADQDDTRTEVGFKKARVAQDSLRKQEQKGKKNTSKERKKNQSIYSFLNKRR